MGHLFHGVQSLQNSCPSGPSMGHSCLQASTSPSTGSFTGSKWISAPPWTSMGCRGTTYSTMVVTTGCRGILARSHITPPTPSELTWASAAVPHNRLVDVSQDLFLHLIHFSSPFHFLQLGWTESGPVGCLARGQRVRPARPMRPAPPPLRLCPCSASSHLLSSLLFFFSPFSPT